MAFGRSSGSNLYQAYQQAIQAGLLSPQISATSGGMAAPFTPEANPYTYNAEMGWSDQYGNVSDEITAAGEAIQKRNAEGEKAASVPQGFTRLGPVMNTPQGIVGDVYKTPTGQFVVEESVPTGTGLQTSVNYREIPWNEQQVQAELGAQTVARDQTYANENPDYGGGFFADALGGLKDLATSGAGQVISLPLAVAGVQNLMNGGLGNLFNMTQAPAPVVDASAAFNTVAGGGGGEAIGGILGDTLGAGYGAIPGSEAFASLSTDPIGSLIASNAANWGATVTPEIAALGMGAGAVGGAAAAGNAVSAPAGSGITDEMLLTQNFTPAQVAANPALAGLGAQEGAIAGFTGAGSGLFGAGVPNDGILSGVGGSSSGASGITDWITKNPLQAASLGITAAGLLGSVGNKLNPEEEYEPAPINQAVVSKYGSIPTGGMHTGGAPNYQGFQTLGTPQGLLQMRLNKMKGLL